MNRLEPTEDNENLSNVRLNIMSLSFSNLLLRHLKRATGSKCAKIEEQAKEIRSCHDLSRHLNVTNNDFSNVKNTGTAVNQYNRFSTQIDKT